MLRSRLICSGAVLVGLVVTAFAWPTARPAAQPSPRVPIDHAHLAPAVPRQPAPAPALWAVAETARPRRRAEAGGPAGARRVEELVDRRVDATAPVGTGRWHHGQDDRHPQYVGRRPHPSPGGVD